MDEMGPQMGGIVLALGSMLGLMAMALAAALGWAGWRRVRRGGLRRALAVTNALALANLGNAAMLLAGGEIRSPLNLWLMLLVFFTGPMLLGYALGTTAALMRRQSASALR